MTMIECFTQEGFHTSTCIEVLSKEKLESWLHKQDIKTANWLVALGIRDNQKQFYPIPDEQGYIKKIIYPTNENIDIWSLADLPNLLPLGQYYLSELSDEQYFQAALGWALSAYRFTRYRKKTQAVPKLFVPSELNHASLIHQIKSIYLVRDLINTPAENMGPADLVAAVEQTIAPFFANLSVIEGDDLLKQNFPAIHAVGRGSKKSPKLIKFTWGDKKNPSVTLIGKGVCFDSGGYNLKSSSNMALMKKDMGGAAMAIGLAQWVMASQLPIYLNVIIPAVENMVSGMAYRPGDVINTRKGITVEIGNTDAEGRLILADCLTLACEEKPDYIFDFATLTGAARVALGPEIPNLFSNNPTLRNKLWHCSEQVNDLVWPIPIHQPYRRFLESHIADINNSASIPYGGAITAALFLQEFVSPEINWAHFDIMAWNLSNQPGRPEGGEAQSLRTMFEFLQTLS